MKKIIFTFLPFVLFLTIPSIAEAEFKDVSLFQKEINYLTELEIIQGHTDGTFRPKDHIQRVHAVEMILREMNIADFSAPDPGFTDMKPGDYGYKKVAKAVELGFINGIESYDGSLYFNPTGSLTRAEMAKIMVEGYDLIENQGISFIDVNMVHWANHYVNRLATANITIGHEDSEFKPNDSLSRQHFAVFMARLLDDQFKNKASNISYLPELTKQLVYKSGDDKIVFSHSRDQLWLKTVYNHAGEVMISKEESFVETQNGVVFSRPQLVFNFTLGYPIKVGHKWIDENAVKMEITDLNSTVRTSAGTFSNVVKVQKSNGYTDYFAPGIGLVKSVPPATGYFPVELIEIKE